VRGAVSGKSGIPSSPFVRFSALFLRLLARGRCCCWGLQHFLPHMSSYCRVRSFGTLLLLTDSHCLIAIPPSVERRPTVMTRQFLTMMPRE
jgi:hypothetical protein